MRRTYGCKSLSRETRRKEEEKNTDCRDEFLFLIKIIIYNTMAIY